ncbi:hypothetical protein Dvina_13875 [Dactylosporangium vinaceum]|uniref:Uncharacterized protein n=1 Tax=Dactylosporangium vinaceum TaxID=53362 RepID=A0ABV5MGG2_9ACTN|nr:hypothetical protein [Dactylosporangium vinaceum]UAB99066.1 hypothetical protein Dvina_13875 [Dactylosporangium vinaceum]
MKQMMPTYLYMSFCRRTAAISARLTRPRAATMLFTSSKECRELEVTTMPSIISRKIISRVISN